MSELIQMLQVQARLHRKQGANALGDLFENAEKEIQLLGEQLAKANERIAELEQSKHKESLETISDYILEFMQANGIENFSTNRLSTNEGRQIELTIRYVDGETPADQLEKARQRIDELESQMQLTALTTHEASFESDYGKKRLNKFAIEQKIEALGSLNNKYRAQTYPIQAMHQLLTLELEQLRKEQEA